MAFIDRRAVLAGSLAVLSAPLRGRADAGQEVIEAARREGILGLAHTVSAPRFPSFMEAFLRKYPFLDVTSGLYSAPTGRVLARVEAELQAGRLTFDALHVASLAPYLSLTKRGALLSYRSAELVAYPASSCSDYWATARVIGVIMAYNHNVLSPEKAPKAWVDILRPEFKGRKLVIQDSAAGTAFNQMYLLEKLLGQDFMRRWGEQQPIVVATTAQLIDLLVRGEALVGATVDHLRAFEPDVIKAGITAVYPVEGMPVAPAPIAIFKDAPHPNAAKLFVDYVLSEEGQTLLAVDILGAYSMRKGVRTAPGQVPLAEAKPLLPTDLADYEAAAQNFPDTFDRYFKN
jgi:iron(III) transport system substrate-binding protein